MSQNLRQIKKRILTIENTKKITNAMEIVSQGKLKALQKTMYVSKNFFASISTMLDDVLASFEDIKHPLIAGDRIEKKVILCVIASDTGMCGSYNYNILKQADNFVTSHKDMAINIVTAGKKAFGHFKKMGMSVLADFSNMHGGYSAANSDKLTSYLGSMYLSGQADAVYVASTEFVSAHVQRPGVEKFLGFTKSDRGRKREYILEPDIEHLTDKLFRLYFTYKGRLILLNSMVSENYMRIIAMKQANDNAKEIQEELILTRNKLRQANITRELIEVISSADALKG